VLFALACALLLAWGAWFLRVPVPVYSLSESARLKVVANIQPINAAATARIKAVHIALGRQVRAGDPLVELDSERLNLELTDNVSQLAALEQQRAALRGELQSAGSGAVAEVGQSRANLEVADSRLHEAQAQLGFARENLTRLEKMGDVIPEIKLIEGRAAYDQANALATTRRKELASLRNSLEVHSSDRDAKGHRLQSELARLERDAAALTSRIAHLKLDIQERTIRAPVDGKIGEAADLLVGMQVAAGDRLGAIVPSGSLKVDARFRPAEAFGRIREGAVGRLTFDGYPWTRYGSAEVRVLGIAQEVRDGLVQVELAVTLPPGSAIPLQHGMPSSVAIETERAVPAALVQRAAGRLVRR
jgi:membrane fusion protein